MSRWREWGAAAAAAATAVAASLGAGLALGSWLRGRAPDGQGAFVRNLKADGKPSASAFADRAEALGFKWVALLGETYNDGMAVGVYDADLPAYAEALRARGIAVWVWGWPKPEDQDRFVEDLERQVKRTKARGVIIDAEGPYVSGQAAAQERDRVDAERLGRAFRDRGITFGVTSFGGGPDFFGKANFPWQAFAKYASFGMPQIYDPPSPEKARAWWKSWVEDTGFRRLVVVLDANNTPEVMRYWWEQLGRPTDLAWWTNDYVVGNKRKENLARAIAGKGGAIA